MKMLERQKQAKNLKVIVNTNNGASTAAGESKTMTTEGDNNTLVRKVLVKNATAKPTCDNKKIASPATKHVEQSSIALTKPIVSPQKVTLPPQKSVVNSQKVAGQLPPKVAAAAKPSKENLLSLYENSYRKTG